MFYMFYLFYMDNNPLRGVSLQISTCFYTFYTVKLPSAKPFPSFSTFQLVCMADSIIPQLHNQHDAGITETSMRAHGQKTFDT